MKKILLSIAGHDPTSGAGASLDLKVFEHFKFQGMAILTSLTSQNTKHVKKIHCLPAELLWDQYKTLIHDVCLSGIKVGMIGCKKNILPVKRILSENQHIPRVVDPVFKSTSGAWLLDKNSLSRYITEIKGKATLLTPNLDEAHMISGIKITNTEDMKEAAQTIYSLTRFPCLIKGGHFKTQNVDMLYDGNTFHLFKKKKIEKNVHGTGCFLSSSLLGYLAKGNSLEKACSYAIELTQRAIKTAVQIGRGQHIISFPIQMEKGKS